MKIIATAKMGVGTFRAKFVPLSQLDQIEKIYIVRKSAGPPIDKVEYIVLPKCCKFFVCNLIIAPIILTKYTKKIKPDFILAYHLIPHAFFAWIASLLTRVPYIFTQTGGKSEILLAKPVVGKLFLRIIRKAKLILCPGEQSKQFWERIIPSVRSIVLHSAIDVNVFRPLDIKPNIDVLYVGILNNRKQVDKIILGFKNLTLKYPNANLTIVGKGPEELVLKKICRELEIEDNVDFVGFQKVVMDYISRAKIFIMASKMEGLPVALMEAMSCEKLVIAPAVDNIPTVLHHMKTGILIDEVDVDSISSALLDAYQNYDKYQHMRKAARKMIVDNYSYSAARTKWAKLLKTD